MRISNIRIALIGIFLIFSMAGCSNSKPSESMGQEVLGDFLKARLKGKTFEIENFKKTNGLEREMMGQKLYIMEFEAAVRFPEGYMAGCLGTSPGLGCIGMSSATIKPTKPGGIQNIKSGEIHFEKTENGWRGSLNNGFF